MRCMKGFTRKLDGRHDDEVTNGAFDVDVCTIHGLTASGRYSWMIEGWIRDTEMMS